MYISKNLISVFNKLGEIVAIDSTANSKNYGYILFCYSLGLFWLLFSLS